jgi:hypothetical protein
MKYIKLVILYLTILVLQSCGGTNQEKSPSERIVVTDEFGQRFGIITIEGCEFYQAMNGRTMGKVDCNCQPVR